VTILTPDEINRRAGGRRRYNLRRRTAAFERTKKVARLLFDGRAGRGAQAEIARALGVSEATVSRAAACVRREPETYRRILENDDLLARRGAEVE
jgi:hypothetical protein